MSVLQRQHTAAYRLNKVFKEKIRGMIMGFGELCLNIRRPNPPIFNKIPASIIDPAVEAST